jgi:glycosyltransferase involved in cell wall biosynthesis
VPECADPGLRAFLEKAVPNAVARAHRVLADSEHTRRDLEELLSVPPAKISVVTPAVERRFRQITDAAQLAEVRGKYHLPPCYILGVGTLEPRKNFARLITAFGRFKRTTGQPHKLVIAGKPGWLYDAIYEQIRREGLSAEVILPGFVADADLPAMYSLAELLAFPSLYEGFGIPPLEAMACGTPVITSDNSSLPEAVGDAARMVNAEDAEELAETLAQVVGDAAERAAMIARGYAQAARFTWRRSAEALMAAYQVAAA